MMRLPDPFWFNASTGWHTVRGRRVKLLNLFNRRQLRDGAVAGWQWAFGLLQVSYDHTDARGVPRGQARHLFFVGAMGLCIGFVWFVGGHNQSPWGKHLE